MTAFLMLPGHPKGTPPVEPSRERGRGNGGTADSWWSELIPIHELGCSALARRRSEPRQDGTESAVRGHALHGALHGVAVARGSTLAV